MAPLLSSNGIRILIQKALLFIVAVASMAAAVEFTFPLVLNFAVNDFPAIWLTLDSYLKPPYLYLLINIIILTITATSHLHQHENQDNQSPSNFLQIPTQHSFGIFDSGPRVFEDPQQPIGGAEMPPMSQQIITLLPPPESTVISPEGEKRAVSFRLPQWKRIKTCPDGARTLKADHGRHMPLRKSATFENHRHSDVETAAGSKKKKVVRKSATLRDRTNYDNENHRPPSVMLPPESGGKLSKDRSLSNDELTRRIEEFINKFNNEMRLQRQESVKQVKGLTNRERK